ncbi:MAG: glycoside hydrolase family 3 C-terminal domain-containing protein, partial [Propionibacteriaceae bacterium]|nr:glycoside hydrolase family 3 C-terminal domain-containing protein [Propionibacteriaceae bacterium]
PAVAGSPVRDAGITPGTALSPGQLAALGAEAHHRLAREAATGAAVLLRNERDTLPLDPAGEQRIAVIGGYAATPRIQGGGSSGVQPTRVDVPLAAIQEIAGADRISWAEGYPVGATDYYQEAAPDPSRAAQLRTEALEVAATAQLVVVFAGLPLADEQEAHDRDHLGLPEAQTRLLVGLAELGKPLIVVLAAGSATVLDPAWHDRCDALLLAHLGGQAVGSATADLLFGWANPSGKLSETWPARLADTPGSETFPDHGAALYPEGLLIGYRWYDERNLPVAYPFGHGLSYTTFAYRDLAVTADDQALEVSVTITNTGSLAGAEIVQVYATPPDSASRPRTLAGFVKLDLAPGENRAARIRVPRRDLACYGDRGWEQPAGAWVIEAAASSRASRLSAVLHLQGRSFPA